MKKLLGLLRLAGEHSPAGMKMGPKPVSGTHLSA